MKVKLYGIVHSHAVLAARLMLERCGVEHEVWNILPGLHAPVVRAAGFPHWTVPALVIDGRHVQGTLAISRKLDRLFPAAGLFPREVGARRAVEEAERWGHDELQGLARRVFRWAGAHSNAVRTWMAREVVGLPFPAAFGMAFQPMMVFFSRRVSGADDETVRADLARLPGLLDHVDAMLELGSIGGPPPTRPTYRSSAHCACCSRTPTFGPAWGSGAARRQRSRCCRTSRARAPTPCRRFPRPCPRRGSRRAGRRTGARTLRQRNRRA